MKPVNVSVTFLPPSWSLTPFAQAKCDELCRRIDDPQDLEDGLLCVALDEVTADFIDSMDQRLESYFLKACGISVPVDQPTTPPKSARW